MRPRLLLHFWLSAKWLVHGPDEEVGRYIANHGRRPCCHGHIEFAELYSDNFAEKGRCDSWQKTGIERIARTGIWSLHSMDQEPANLDRQIGEILAKLTADLETWQRLERAYRLDLFCGLFMDGENEGLEISPASLVALGQRGITLALDVYRGD